MTRHISDYGALQIGKPLARRYGVPCPHSVREDETCCILTNDLIGDALGTTEPPSAHQPAIRIVSRLMARWWGLVCVASLPGSGC